MRLMRRGLGPLTGLLLAFLGLWLIAASAQAQMAPVQSGDNPFALLQGLSPSEQQAILGRITGAGTLGQGTSELNNTPGGVGQFGQLNQQQLQQLQQEMQIRQKRLGEEQQSLIPILKAGDWVIIEIGLHLAPRQASESTVALQQAYASQSPGATLSPEDLKALQS